jgi:hypothetical protein
MEPSGPAGGRLQILLRRSIMVSVIEDALKINTFDTQCSLQWRQ